jgi:hypothetical protein
VQQQPLGCSWESVAPSKVCATFVDWAEAGPQCFGRTFTSNIAMRLDLLLDQVLEQDGVAVGAEHRERILGCTDLALLEGGSAEP